MGLFHGWVVDPNDRAAAEAVGSTSYNQLVEIVINAQYAQGQASDPVVKAQIERGRVCVQIRTFWAPSGIPLLSRAPPVPASCAVRPLFTAVISPAGSIYFLIQRSNLIPESPNLYTLGPRTGSPSRRPSSLATASVSCTRR